MAKPEEGTVEEDWIREARELLGAEQQARRALALAAVSSFRPLMPIWRDALEQVGTQIERLRAAMGNTGVAALERLADAGLNGITGRLQVGLMKELLEFEAAARSGDPKATARQAGQLRASIGAFRSFLGSDRVVALLDSNPWGVSIELRASLGQALDTIDSALPA